MLRLESRANVMQLTCNALAALGPYADLRALLG